MKNLILCNSLYNDMDALSNLISTMEYEKTLYGSEIKEFNFIPQGLNNRFNSYLGIETEIQHNTGVFRKPNSSIHVEPFYQHCLWLGIVALEDTVLKLYEQENVKTLFDVEQENAEQFMLDNCNDPSKWTVTQTINIRKNEFVFIRPWLWYSLEEDKLVQIYLLNQKIEEKEE